MTPDARRDEAISRGLAKRLEQLAAERERRERAAEKADAEFSNEFLNAARRCFEMIDDDQSGTLEKAEIVTAVKSNQKVIKFLINCGNKNLQYLLVPACVEINQCVGFTRQFFTKSFRGNDVAVLARSSGEEPASPRHRAGVASMAWRTTR